ncbi:MAG: 2-hydroxymuconate tautomerase [bacterium]
MPIVTIEMFEGRSVEQKKKTAKEVTKVVAGGVGCTENDVIVLFRDIPKQNWAMGGELASEK